MSAFQRCKERDNVVKVI